MLARLYIPSIAMLVFGYPMTTIALLLFGFPVGQINQFLKALYAGLFLLSIISSLLNRRTKIPVVLLPFFVFFGLYGFRLIYDILVQHIYAPMSSPMYVLSYFFLLTMLPALAIAISYNRMDLSALNRWIHIVLFLLCLMVIVYLVQSGGDIVTALAIQRFEVRGEDEQVALLSPITVGMCGAALSLLSIGYFVIGAKANRKFAVTIVGFLLGLIVLFLSGSRGPLLSFLVAASFLSVTVVRRFKDTGIHKQVLRKRFIRIYFVISAILLALGLLALNGQGLLLALTRLVETSSAVQHLGDGEIRIDIAADALDRLVESPIIGTGHLALNATAYAHNSILEALMATGIVGFAFFFSIWVRFFAGAIKVLTFRLDPMAYPLTLVCIAMITLSLVSMSLSQSPEIWLMVALVLTIVARDKISVDERAM